MLVNCPHKHDGTCAIASAIVGASVICRDDFEAECLKRHPVVSLAAPGTMASALAHSWALDNAPDRVPEVLKRVGPHLKRVTKPPKVFQLKTAGPGTELLAMSAAKGIPGCQACHDLAAKMDEWGVEGCRERLGEITLDMLPRAKQWFAEKRPWMAWAADNKVGDAVILLGLRGWVTEAINSAESKMSAVVPDAPFMSISRMVVITCYFNPCGYIRPRENYWRFREGMEKSGVELFTAELAFGDQPFEIADAALQLRGDERNIVWQKERLLNLLIRELPADVDAIAWIDADVLFLNRDWAADTRRALETRAVVQPYDMSYTLMPDGALKPIKKSTGWFYVHDGPRFADFDLSHPGFAWAARAEWVRRHGLLDECVTGGGDCLMVQGIADVPLSSDRWITPAWKQTIDVWAAAVQADVKGSFGYVPGTILHCYHGSREDRKYYERWSYQFNFKFDPKSDIETDASGLIRWTDPALREKPEMVRRIKEYFTARREDA